MKNKTGIISGFFAGSLGFLLLFKVIILDHISPEDELAPGIVVLAAILIGVVCAFTGHLVQNTLEERGIISAQSCLLYSSKFNEPKLTFT